MLTYADLTYAGGGGGGCPGSGGNGSKEERQVKSYEVGSRYSVYLISGTKVLALLVQKYEY
jgi:hypothetical protein